jgi:hypothetical protein
MNNKERLDLKNLMNKMGDGCQYEDNTSGIREMKHSIPIARDIHKMEILKKQKADLRRSSPSEFAELCEQECAFLFSKYTDIYNRLLKDEIDLIIMFKALQTLKRIEDGELDQHEGSVIVGKLFHEIYVDSALKRSANLDAENSDSTAPPPSEGKKMSWRDFKKDL